MNVTPIATKVTFCSFSIKKPLIQRTIHFMSGMIHHKNWYVIGKTPRTVDRCLYVISFRLRYWKCPNLIFDRRHYHHQSPLKKSNHTSRPFFMRMRFLNFVIQKVENMSNKVYIGYWMMGKDYCYRLFAQDRYFVSLRCVYGCSQVSKDKAEKIKREKNRLRGRRKRIWLGKQHCR